MKKWLSSLFLLILFSGAAWADSANPTIYSDAVANKTDVSIAYLSSVFGTVSGVLTGTSGQMLGKLLYQFNQGMLVVAGCWLAFSVLMMVFKSATTGSFMQQDNKVPMILLRIALGFGLLIPNPSTGYTLLQGIVMQVTVQGVKLANQVWDYGLDYLSSGGALWSSPTQQAIGGATNADGTPTSSQNTADISSILGDQNNLNVAVPDYYTTLSLIQKIMAMEACMVQMSVALNSGSTDPDAVTTPSTPLSVYENIDKSRFEFPAGNSSSSTGCGIIYWNSLVSKPNMDCASNDDNSPCGYSHLALKEIVNDLLPAVKKYVCINSVSSDSDSSSVCSGVNTDDVDTTYISDAMMSAFLNYENLISPVLRQDAMNTGNNPLAFVDKAHADGWMMAGRYYWDLMRLEDSYTQVGENYRNYIPDAKSYVGPAASGTVDVPSNDALTASTGLMVSSIGYIGTVNSQLNNFGNAASSGSLSTSSLSSAQSASAGVMKLVVGAFLPVFSDLAQIIVTFSTQAGPQGLGPEPIIWLHNLGMSCLSLGLNIWIGIAISLFPVLLATGVCGALSSIPNAINGVIDWLRPFTLAIGAAFIVLGVSLGFYLPLHPYLLFTFGVIGWMTSVLEAMVAAPLVAMGITHPEGHDFLGKAQQAVMLCLGLFLQPVLMLIGLFAGMILCQVSLSICLYTFSSFCSDIFSVSGPASGGPTGDLVLQAAGLVASNVFSSGAGTGWAMLFMPLVVFPLFLGVFAMTVYTVTVNCFSVIYQLPNYILTWIGGPQGHGLNAQSMADQVKQSMSGMAKMGDGVGSLLREKGKEKSASKGSLEAKAANADQGNN